MDLGDRITSFFHKSVIQRASRNHIHFLRDSNGSLIGAKEEVKSHAVDYFKMILGSYDLPLSPCSVLQLQGLLSFRCSNDESAALVKPVSAEEVRSTLFDMPLNKCPGPDGYSVEFFRSAWSIVGSDVVVAVQ